jgi:hypothetical protein
MLHQMMLTLFGLFAMCHSFLLLVVYCALQRALSLAPAQQAQQAQQEQGQA